MRMVRRRLVSLAAAFVAMGATVVGITAVAQPAAALATCHAYTYPPEYGDSNYTTVEGYGLTTCSTTMVWVRVDLQLNKAVDGTWTPQSDGYYVLRNTTAVTWTINAACKDTGTTNWETGAKGSGMQYADNPASVEDDPSDGGSYYWSDAYSMCSNPPPPPDPKQGVGGVVGWVQRIA